MLLMVYQWGFFFFLINCVNGGSMWFFLVLCWFFFFFFFINCVRVLGIHGGNSGDGGDERERER